MQSYPLKPHCDTSNFLVFPILCRFPGSFYEFREFLGSYDFRRGHLIDGKSVVDRAVPSCPDFSINMPTPI